MLQDLNEQQKEVILKDDNILLIACPGSGKTRVLAYKLAQALTELKNKKQFVIGLTYTNRAADEIDKRIEKLSIDRRQLWTGTIHSFCLDWILRPYAGYSSDLKNGFNLADEHYCEKLIEDIKASKKLDRYTVLKRMNKNGSTSPKTAAEITLAKEYFLHLRERRLIDFDLILELSIELLNSYSSIPKSLSSLFTLICVDEYQDTQELQYRIISEIIKTGHTKLFLVGDPDQAIFGSLGGIAKNVKEISLGIGKKVLEMSLTGNYRTNQRVINYYQKFQDKNIQIEAKGLNAKDKGLITFNEAVSADDVHIEISRLIQMSLNKGIPQKEICVLAPQWWLITSMARKLKKELPNLSFDAPGLSPMSRSRDNVWFKVARLLLTEPSVNMYTTRLRWANELIFELQHSGLNLGEIDTGRKMLRLLNKINSSEIEGINYLKDCFSIFLGLLGIVLGDYKLLEEKYKSFFDGINKKLQSGHDYPLDLESFRNLFRNATGIVINTCQGIKGEEFEVVISFGLLHGYVPHWNDIIDKSINEDISSRKTLYVICSRAKSDLHIISETGRTTTKNSPLETNSHLKNYLYKYDTI